jgi:antitoxin component of MazEF toxin-antitoxin module
MDTGKKIVARLGTRKVLKGTRSLVLTIPRTAVMTLDLVAGEDIDVSLTSDGEIIFKKIDG